MRLTHWKLLAAICALLLSGFPVPAADNPARAQVLQSGLARRASTPDPWFDATFALAALHLNQDLDAANTVLARIPGLWPIDAESKDEPVAYWAFSAIARSLLAHGASGTGRLSTSTENALKSFFWPYTSVRSNPDTTTTWILEGSENHDLMRKSVHYIVTTAFASDPAYRDRRFRDGRTAAEHRDLWTAYFRSYIPERARKGLFVEVASQTYAKYDLQCLVNLRDLAPDSLVRAQSEKLMHLLWADWAQDQVAGLRGGGKSRIYPGKDAHNGARDGMHQASQIYFEPTGPVGNHPATVLLATSDYAPPDLVRKIGFDRPVTRYTSYSRRPGAGTVSQDPAGYGSLNTVDPDNSLLRIVRVTPDAILGTIIFDPRIAHTSVSAQNRWSGVVFPTGPDRRVYLGCGSTREDKPQHYDALITAQSGPVLVARKKFDAHKYNRTPYIVVPHVLDVRTEKDNWLFIQEGDGYVGIHVSGGYTWEADRMVLVDPWAPILMASGSRDEQGSFEEFTTRLLQTTIQHDAATVTYSCLGQSISVSLSTDTLPLINGQPPELQPPYTYWSPYLNASWDSSVVRISCGVDELLLDFRAGPVVPSDTTGALPADFDGDGTVGFADLVRFVAQLGKHRDDTDFDPRLDLDGDGAIAFLDFVLLARDFGRTASTS